MFRTNLVSVFAKFNNVVNDRAQLSEAPDHVLSALSVGRSTDPSVYNNGPWNVHLHPSSLFPFLRYCDSRERRENVFTSWSTRASFKQVRSDNAYECPQR